MGDDRPTLRRGEELPPDMPRSRRIPGDIGWKPEADDVARAAGTSRGGAGPEDRGGAGLGRAGVAGPGLALRIVSVIPFIFGGVVGAIALASWVLIFLLGFGDQETIWAWASGRPASEVVTQVALVLLLGLASLAVAGTALWAALHGFHGESGRVFWTAAQLVLGLSALGMVAVDRFSPEVFDGIGLGTFDWWLLFALVALGLVTARLRTRVARAAGAHGDAPDRAG